MEEKLLYSNLRENTTTMRDSNTSRVEPEITIKGLRYPYVNVTDPSMLDALNPEEEKKTKEKFWKGISKYKRGSRGRTY